MLKSFLRDDRGTSAAEYALIVALIGMGIGAAAIALGANASSAVGNAARDIVAPSSGAT